MGTELAKAYVQIIPSAKGIKGSISNVISPEANNAGVSAGGLLVSKMKKIIVSAGIGKALQATISEGAAVEQSTGGIETLFKGSADKVIATAQKAYKTAGMSANQYMETVTGFSASLLQGLSGDTNKAADVADMALTDMSDNANKMGTDMELIQNAYQGFAKQNYTMLDNLKLGYGGTKTEMQRLLADAEKITGVKYDINNLSDVYSAIHVIQEEMGITGTTAKEASETVSGSFAAMKGAVSTFLGNLATGQDIMPSLKAVGETAYTFVAGNLLPMIGNILAGIGKTIMTISWGGLISSVIDTINERLPEILTKGVETVSSFANGILNNLPKIITSAGEIILKFVTCISNNLPKILESGVKLLLNLVNGIIKNLPKVVSAAVDVVKKLLTTIQTNAPKLIESGITLIGKLLAGIIKAVPDLLAKIPGIIKDIKSVFSSVDWGTVGKNIIKGIANGIRNAVSTIVSAVKEACKKALKTFEDFWDINSPSVVGEKRIGKNIDLGIAGGIKKYGNSMTDAIKRISQDNLSVAEKGTLALETVNTEDVKRALMGQTKNTRIAGRSDISMDNLGNRIVREIKEYGDKQAKAIEKGLKSVKIVSNNRETARFITDLGFVRG